MKNTCISNPDGDNHSNRKMDNADAWRATIPISSHDFPSNGSYKNLFPQLIGSLENGFGYYKYIFLKLYFNIKEYLEMQSGKLFPYVLQQELLFLTLNTE